MRRTARVEISNEGTVVNVDTTLGPMILIAKSNRIISICDMRWVNLYGYGEIKGYGNVHKIIGDEE